MASAASPSCSEALRPTVLVSNDLMQIIKDPEKNETSPPSIFAHLTTMDELLMHVKNYIVKHKLYDPKNPIKILLHENELGSLLGKSEFSLLDVRDILLKKFVFPVVKKNSSEVICSISDKMSASKKRELDNDSEMSAKRIKGFDDTRCDDSKHSFQGHETEFVKDSNSDNSSVNGLIIAETFDIDVEYEIQTDSEYSYDSECSYNSDHSDLEDFVKKAIINFIARTSESDIEYLADGSSDDESEKELSEEDKWRCLSCGTMNDPVMRNCCACWKTTRVGWLAERSERQNEKDINAKERKRKRFARRKGKLSKKSYRNKDSLNPKLSDLPVATTESLSSPSSSSNDNSNDTLSDLPKSAAAAESLGSPSTFCNDHTYSIQSPSNLLEADKDKNTKIELDKELCLFCCTRPADSTIIHGKIGCRVCCFKCGQKLYNENKRCPVCRRSIERIVYLFHS